MSTRDDVLISPHGGHLVDLLAPVDEREELRRRAGQLPALQLTERSVCDLELLASGGFSPLDRFMGRTDHDRVVGEMRLATGALFPIPVALPLPDGVDVHLDGEMALRSPKNELLAVMRVEEIYGWDPDEVARGAFGTVDATHPMVAELQRTPRRHVSGALRVLHLPRHYDFAELRLTPAQARARLAASGRRNVVAFQTRNPMHRVHEELTRRARAWAGVRRSSAKS